MDFHKSDNEENNFFSKPVHIYSQSNNYGLNNNNKKLKPWLTMVDKRDAKKTFLPVFFFINTIKIEVLIQTKKSILF